MIIKSLFSHLHQCLVRVPAIFRHRNLPNFTPFFPRTKHFLKYHANSTDSDIYNFNIKLTSLGRNGKLEQAKQLFDKMPHKDSVSYASMITLYVKSNNLSLAEKLYESMPERDIVADSAMIDGYAKAGLMHHARKVFDDMPERNVFSWTSLMSGYFKNGPVDEARRLFYEMPEKNVVSWTTAVVGFARSGLIDEARCAFEEMPDRNIVAWTSMVKCYVENQQIDEACNLFYAMPERNLYSWNIIISGCLANQRVNEAVRLFESMKQWNVVSWTTMVTGLAHNGFTAQAREYFDRMPRKDIAAWNAMITAYVDDGMMVEARDIFDSMVEKNIVTWNAMIDGYAKNGPNGEALNHLIFMFRSCIRPNENTITIILTSCGGILELMQAHVLVVKYGFEQNTSLSNALITMYSKSGDLRSSRLAFQILETKDVVSWTSMILAYSIHGHGGHALHVFARMLKFGAKPDGVTFVGVMSACSHAGLVKKGQMLFDSMSRIYGLKPKAEHYSCLVDILGRAGQVHEAMRVVCEMPPSERDAAVLGAMLGACRLHGDVGVAYQVGEKLIELEPSNAGGYVLLSNVYAACGKWEEFAELRMEMKDRNVKKVPGVSQIEVNGMSHEFYVGDRTHPQTDEIYGLLKEQLLPIMQEMEDLKETPMVGISTF